MEFGVFATRVTSHWAYRRRDQPGGLSQAVEWPANGDLSFRERDVRGVENASVNATVFVGNNGLDVFIVDIAKIQQAIACSGSAEGRDYNQMDAGKLLGVLACLTDHRRKVQCVDQCCSRPDFWRGWP